MITQNLKLEISLLLGIKENISKQHYASLTN